MGQIIYAETLVENPTYAAQQQQQQNQDLNYTAPKA
jgi:hypothetical protein